MSDRDESAFEALVVQAVEKMEADGPEAIDEICRAHPDQAEALRSAIAPLAAIGLAPSRDSARRSPSPAIGPGRRFADGEFELIREIGRGGMGIVFEARQTSLGRRVALKLLARPLELDPTAVRRFEREAQIAASLNHSGIAEVYAFGVDEGIHYLAMELVEGTPLDVVIRETRTITDWNDRGRALPPGTHDNYLRATLELVETIANALAYAHEKGIVHRDIKPSNVLIRPDGSPVITDFGLAQNVDLPGLTRTGAFVGTPHYTAPEQQTHRDDDVDGRADVFSLGVTLYELLTDRRPFGGDSTREILHAVATMEPSDPQTANPRLPNDVAAIVLKALEKEPEGRYPTARAFAADLRAFLEFRPVLAKRAGTATRIRRWVRREPLRAALLGILVVAVPALAALAGYIVANRPLVDAAERQALRDAAETSLISGYISGLGRNPNETEALLAQALGHDATRTEALVVLTFGRLQSDPEGCEAVLERHTEGLDEPPRTVRRLQAMCARVRGDLERAERIERALGEPTTAMEHLVLGRWYRDRGPSRHKHDRSEAALEHLQIAAMLSASPRPTILHSLAIAAGDLRKEQIARATAREIMERWPGEAFAWEAKAFALEHIDPDTAIEAYRQALTLANDRVAPRVLSNLGQLYVQQNRLQEGRDCLEECLRLDPGNSFAQATYAYMHLFREIGTIEDAIPHATAAIELATVPADRIRGYRLLIRALSHAGRGAEAVDTAECALDEFPDAHLVYSDYLNALLETGDFAKTLAVSDRIVDTAPDRSLVLGVRADALVGLDRRQEAVESLHARALEDPTDPAKWHDLALQAMQRGPDGERIDAGLGLAACRRATALTAEGNPFMTITLASALLDVEDCDEAARLLDVSEKTLAEPRWSRDRERMLPEIESRRARIHALRARDD